MDGNHTIEKFAIITENVLHQVFNALHQYRVIPEYILLKPNLVISGNDCAQQASVEDVAIWTVKIFKRTVPAAVPSINYLSGGQSDKLATAHLNAINKLGPFPWYMSFSYGRALQSPVLKAWEGNSANIELAQQALLKRAKLNSAATQSQYDTSME